jgi:hypothetical protein
MKILFYIYTTTAGWRQRGVNKLVVVWKIRDLTGIGPKMGLFIKARALFLKTILVK